MHLIGMLDSPYVRRVAISLRLLELPFEHRAVSVFTTFEQFQRINPVVKAPSLVCDDGEVLMDSTLILEYAEALSAPRKSLMPSSIAARQHALRAIGLALAACDKTVQYVYETNLRPVEKQHQPWLDRVRGQLLAAYGALEVEVRRGTPDASKTGITQAGVTSAVSWSFGQMMLPEIVLAAEHPALRAFSAQAEELEAFVAAPPVGPGVVHA
jgi:glutathione S-transferase